MQVPIVEQLKEMNGWKGHANGPNNAFITVFQETFFNAIFGWCLGTGYYARGSYFEALTSTCGFRAGLGGLGVANHSALQAP